jgi:hypothetical protein
MDNSQNTPRTLIPPIDRLLLDNVKQSLDITHGYNVTNPELTNKNGKIIKGSDGRVFNINNQGVATYYPNSDVYNETSGKRGVLGSGNYSADQSSIPTVPYIINPNVNGYDENSKLYVNGNVRPGQSQGDEINNIFAGVKTPGSFQYKGCSAFSPNNSPSESSSKELIILDASYGSNCGNATGNRTQIVQDYITNNPDKTTFNIGRNEMEFGDPFFGCNKQMSITYTCNGKTNTVTRTDGKFDSGSSLDITCNPQSQTSLTKCYYDALAKGLSYFGLGNVDSNTNLGTCYIGNSDILNSWWQNPGIPIWKIDMRKDLNYSGNDLSCIFVGQNSNLYFSLDGIHTNEDYNFYTLCKLGKLPNCDPSNANVFIAEWNALNTLFLANGNMYIFRFPQEGPVPSDVRENPEKYFQYLVYSSGTQGQNLSVGWNEKDISSGVSGRAGGNMLVSSNNGYDPLMVGQSMYSLDGKLKLTLHEDYSLVLYTGDPNAVGCKSDMSNNSLGYGGIAVNQINSLNTDDEKYLGKLAYVNRTGTAYQYTDTSLFNYSDKYTSNPGYSINDIGSNKNATKYNDTDGFVYDNTSSSIDRCQLQCSKSGSCVGTVIDNGNCYLLNDINNNDVVYKDAVKGSGYTKYPNSTRAAYDIGSPPYPTPQVSDCTRGCDEREDCGGFVYWDWVGYCWLKDKEGVKWITPTDPANDDYESAAWVKNTGQSQPTLTIRVPEINKEGKPSYSVYPNNDLWGADLGSTTTNTANDCLDICNKTEGCYSVAFDRRGNGAGTCYPKTYKETSNLTLADNIDAYIRNPEKIENPMEATYTKYPNTTRAAYDIGSPPYPTPQVSDCMKGCNEREDCGGFVYWDWLGYCWLKDKEGVKWITPTDPASSDYESATWVKNQTPVGTSYLIPTNVNVVDTNKFANYNISGSSMTNTTHDISLMPESITNNFLQTTSQLKTSNDKIVSETDRIIRESFTSTQIYENNDKNLSKLDNRLNDYMNENPKLSTNIVTLNKMVSNSSIQMRYLDIVSSILFIIVCILLVVAFTISL